MKLYILFLVLPLLLLAPLLYAQTPPDDLSGIAFILDPGHSQNENVGIYGYSEAYKVLDVGLHLREFLRLSNADTVAMTRTDRNTVISVNQRATFSQNFPHPNKWFHSIHSDASSIGSPANSILILIPDNCAILSGKICQSKYGNTTISMGNWMSDLMSRTYRISTRGVYGDRTFGTQFGTNYGNSGLGVFQSSVVSTLSEGGFHTNSRQNLLNMNFESKRSEAKAIWMAMLGHFGVSRPPIRTLLGVITDFESGSPVNGVTVTLGNRTYTTNTYQNTFQPYAGGDTTLGNGFYYFEGLDAGLQSITISHPQFGDTTMHLTVIDSFFTFQDVRLISTLPPRITSAFPAQGATGVLPNATMQLTFSRPLHRSS
ncbi:MAG: N-acetylmuramoyl-L-alanine amidase, partial [Bacteroidota bacterium]